MIIAVLFNSDDTKYHGIYGDSIRTTILSSNVLQESNRHMKIAIGDVLIYSHSKTKEMYKELAERTFFEHPWQRLLKDKLMGTYLNATVFAWVIQNITEEIAEKLHLRLITDSAYLGMHVVDYSYPVHLFFYRNLMIDLYRIKGRKCNLFFSMSEEDSKNLSEFEEIKKLGFDLVQWEDRGAQKTIFDKYDTVEHFGQIKEFEETISSYLNGGVDEAGELSMVLEDLDTRLFNVLGAAVRALKRARNTEDIAQASLSGRRYLKQLADALYPAQNTQLNGHELTKGNIKNRFWAYIEDSLATENSENKLGKLNCLGREVDRLWDFFSTTLHANPDKKEFCLAYGDLAKLSVSLLSLRAETIKNPYYSYEHDIKEFLKKSISK